ncbi:MAG: hypothetical protein KC503_20065 [Myxococcales bacterium]|nr:hypothetical protein [Myxococcales bacterium]
MRGCRRRLLAAAALCALAAAAAAGCAAEPEGTLRTHVDDWRDEVIYQIVVDRFDNGDPSNDRLDGVGVIKGDLARYQGGDWRGVINRLGYIERLGASAIWLSPVVENVARNDYQDGYHGYWASDFTRVNRRFGSLSDLQALVAEAHRRGIKVIIDIVTNHAGRVFFYDFDGDGRATPGEIEPAYSARGPIDAPLVWLSPKPPHVFRYLSDDPSVPPERVPLRAEHFHRRGQTTDHDDPVQKERGDFPTGLRDLDTERDDVVRAMIDTYLRWVELTDVDGFRLDAVPHVPRAFWQRFARALRQRLADRGKHRFMLLGEVFDGDAEKLASYTRDGGLDAVFDFPLKWEVIDGFIYDGNPAASTRGALAGYRDHFPQRGHDGGVELSPWQARVAMASNHDMPRLRYWLNDPFAAELAMTVVFTVDAVPAIYYGCEQALDGGWGNLSREPLWRAKRAFDESARTYRAIQTLARLRREQRALRRGTLQVRYASKISARQRGAGAGLLAYERADGDSRVLVALNGHPIDNARARVPTGFAPGTRLRDALAGERLVVDDSGGVSVDVAPRRALILVAE